MLIMGQEVLVRMMLEALGAAGTNLENCAVHLFTNDVDPGPAALIADFVEADYDGYGSVLVPSTLGDPYDDGNGNAIQEAPAMIFQPTGSTTPNVIVGWWMDGTWAGTGARVVAYTRLPAPVTLATPLDALVVQSRVALNQPVGI